MQSLINSRPFVFRDTTKRLKTQTVDDYSHMHPVRTVHFSPDGRYLAAGDDKGVLSIRDTTSQWSTIRMYQTTDMIRAIRWHPTISGALVIGSTNGDLNKLLLRSTPNEDFKSVFSLPGYIHAISFDVDGSQLAVAFGDTCKVALMHQDGDDFESPFGQISYLPLQGGGPPIRGIHFLPGNLIAVTSPFGGGGFVTYSTQHPHPRQWEIAFRDNIGIGGSAISPSGHLLAVTNLSDGLDWYSMQEKRYMCTTRYELGRIFMIDIQFLNETTVVAGTSRSQLVFACYGMSDNPYFVNMSTEGLFQAVDVAVVRNRLAIATASCDPQTRGGSVVCVLIDRHKHPRVAPIPEETPAESRTIYDLILDGASLVFMIVFVTVIWKFIPLGRYLKFILDLW